MTLLCRNHQWSEPVGSGLFSHRCVRTHVRTSQGSKNERRKRLTARPQQTQKKSLTNTGRCSSRASSSRAPFRRRKSSSRGASLGTFLARGSRAPSPPPIRETLRRVKLYNRFRQHGSRRLTLLSSCTLHRRRQDKREVGMHARMHEQNEWISHTLLCFAVPPIAKCVRLTTTDCI